MPVVESDESENDEALDVPGKKSKTNPKNNQKSLNSTPSKRNSNYNNIMLIKNEQIVSNSSSLRKLKAQNLHLASSPHSKHLTSVTHQPMLDSAPSAAERQQQNPSATSLGVSDRMSKEKQKFFRFSVFNSERKAKAVDQKNSLNNNKANNNNNNDHEITANGISDVSAGAYDKYKFVSSSDSEHERDTICDKTNKAKGKSVSVDKKTLPAASGAGRKVNTSRDAKAKAKLKAKSKVPSTSDSSCCSSDEDSGSSSDTSTSSSGSSTSSSVSSSTGSCSSADNGATLPAKTSSLANKAEAINTMNVFACINSRELTNQPKRAPYCWPSMPFAKNQQNSLFKKQSNKSRSFGSNSRNENEVWGFAAEAKKSLNIFNNSDSESRTHRLSNFSGTESDCQMSLLSLGSTVARNRISRSNRDAGLSRFTHQMPSLAAHVRKRSTIASEYMLANRRTTTLMRNNTIMSSDDEAKQLSPSNLIRKAVNYKKFDNNTLNNKKLIMDTSLNGAKYGFDDRPVKEATKASVFESSESSSKQSQPPYNNHSNSQSDMGKKLT